MSKKVDAAIQAAAPAMRIALGKAYAEMTGPAYIGPEGMWDTIEDMVKDFPDRAWVLEARAILIGIENVACSVTP